jgi:hypothetical protein
MKRMFRTLEVTPPAGASPTTVGTSGEVVSRQFRLQLHRGISYLATPHAIKSIADLVRLVEGEERAGSAGCKATPIPQEDASEGHPT